MNNILCKVISIALGTAALVICSALRDTVIVESISRFARNTRDLLEFISKKESIDTTTPSGKFMLTVFAAVAELERGYILDRQREGIAITKEFLGKIYNIPRII